MKSQQLLNQILPILHSVKDDEEKLQQILDFLIDEIYGEPNETVEIPEKYKALVKNTAESIDCGMICYINSETLEMEDVPGMMEDDPHEHYMVTGMKKKDLGLKHDKWETYIRIEPPESSESFDIMEKFVAELDDEKLAKRLINALNDRRPFANFKNLIDQSGYREKWFTFKKRKLEEYVWETLSHNNIS